MIALLRISTTLCIALTLSLFGYAAYAQADYVVHNARVYTASPEQPEAEAFAVRGGRILMVGSNEAILDAYPDARRYDADGQTIVPGLIDAHAHLMNLGKSLIQADLVGTTSVENVVERLQAYAKEQPRDAWLIGRGWDQNDWPTQAFPTRQDLDAAFPNQPVWLTRIDGHAAWGNTAALEAAGLEALRTMDDPEGGTIRRNSAGAPTGVFIDAAMSIVESEVPPLSEEQLDAALTEALAATSRNGLTGVHDAGVDLATVQRYQRFIDRGQFPLRLYGMIGGRGETFDYFCREGYLAGDGAGRLTVRAVKFYVDGALGSRGAALLADYSDDAGNQGLLMQQPSAFAQDVADAVACGFQVNTHAIGDRANRIVLDAYAQVGDSTLQTIDRHRVEHAQVLAPEDISRFAELGVIASMQPTHATSDMYWAEDRLGAERAEGAYAWRSLLDSGARLAFGSDFPVEQVNPLLGFYAAVTRQDDEQYPEGGWHPEERVTRAEALHGFTLGAAYAAYQEHELGSIEPGKRADFVVLSRNIMDIPESEILETEVVGTYLNGEAVHGGLQ